MPRIVHVREHEVLPDEDPELVAEIVKRVGLVDHRAADAHHVHAGVAQQLERGAILSGGRASELARSSGVQQTPRQKIGVPLTVRPKPLAVGAAIDGDGAEADATEIDRMRHAVDVEVQTDAVTGLVCHACVATRRARRR